MAVTTFTEERKAIEDYIKVNFDSFQTPIKFDNVDFLIQGNESIADSTTLDEWVRFTIRNDDSLNTVVGNKRTRIFGAVQASIFAREKQGTGSSRTIADEIYELMANQVVDGITFQSPVLTQLPAQDGWYQHVLTINYYWDRCRD